ncbi:transposase [Candidatus Neomarinimicrobiota bacterium]
MSRKRYTPAQIIHLVGEAEVLINQGMNTVDAARQIGTVEQTCYRWRKEYGGMKVNQAKRLIAEKELDIQILKETLALESKTSEPGERNG